MRKRQRGFERESFPPRNPAVTSWQMRTVQVCQAVRLVFSILSLVNTDVTSKE